MNANVQFASLPSFRQSEALTDNQAVESTHPTTVSSLYETVDLQRADPAGAGLEAATATERSGKRAKKHSREGHEQREEKER